MIGFLCPYLFLECQNPECGRVGRCLAKEALAFTSADDDDESEYETEGE